MLLAISLWLLAFYFSYTLSVRGQRFFTLSLILLNISIGMTGSSGLPLSISLCAMSACACSVQLRSAFLKVSIAPISMLYSFPINTIVSMRDNNIARE